MYICPTCQKEYSTEADVVKHFSICWKEKNPYHESKPAPRSNDIVHRQVDSGVLDFFEMFQKERM